MFWSTKGGINFVAMADRKANKNKRGENIVISQDSGHWCM